MKTCAVCHHEWGDLRGRTPTAPNVNATTRREARHTAVLRVAYVSTELEVEATTRDLSLGGVFIRSQVLDPIGTTCQLTIHAEGRGPLHVDGVVRRVVTHEQEGEGPVGIAVEFVDIGEIKRAWLEAVVASMTDHR